METVHKVAKNTGIILAGKAISSLLLMATAILLARSLGAEDFGLYSFVFAYIAFFNILADLGLKTILVREISRKSSETDKLVGNVIIMKAGLALFALVLACLIISFLNYPFNTKILVYIASLSFFSTFGLLYEAIFQANFRMGYAVGVNIIDAVLKLILFSILIFIKAPLVWFVFITVLASCPGFLIIINLSGKFIKPKFKLDFKICKGLLRESWPLALTAMFIMLYMRIDQIMLFSMRGAEEVGYYAAAVRLVEVFNILPLAFTVSVFPLLSQYFITSKDNLKKVYSLSFKYLSTAIMPISMGVCILSMPIVKVIYGKQFLDAVPALQILIWSEVFAFLGVAHVNVLISVGLQRLDFIFTLSGAVVNIFLNLLLIPRYGIVGASIATVISYGLGIPLSCALPKTREYGLALVRSIFKPLFAAGIMGGITYCAFIFNVPLIANIFISGIIYFMVIILIRGIDNYDKQYFKKMLIPV